MKQVLIYVASCRSSCIRLHLPSRSPPFIAESPPLLGPGSTTQFGSECPTGSLTCSHCIFFLCEQEFRFRNPNSSLSWSKGRRRGKRTDRVHWPPVQVSGGHSLLVRALGVESTQLLKPKGGLHAWQVDRVEDKNSFSWEGQNLHTTS